MGVPQRSRVPGNARLVLVGGPGLVVDAGLELLVVGAQAHGLEVVLEEGRLFEIAAPLIQGDEDFELRAVRPQPETVGIPFRHAHVVQQRIGPVGVVHGRLRGGQGALCEVEFVQQLLAVDGQLQRLPEPPVVHRGPPTRIVEAQVEVEHPRVLVRVDEGRVVAFLLPLHQQGQHRQVGLPVVVGLPREHEELGLFLGRESDVDVLAVVGVGQLVPGRVHRVVVGIAHEGVPVAFVFRQQVGVELGKPDGVIRGVLPHPHIGLVEQIHPGFQTLFGHHGTQFVLRGVGRVVAGHVVLGLEQVVVPGAQGRDAVFPGLVGLGVDQPEGEIVHHLQRWLRPARKAAGQEIVGHGGVEFVVLQHILHRKGHVGGGQGRTVGPLVARPQRQRHFRVVVADVPVPVDAARLDFGLAVVRDERRFLHFDMHDGVDDLAAVIANLDIHPVRIDGQSLAQHQRFNRQAFTDARQGSRRHLFRQHRSLVVGAAVVGNFGHRLRLGLGHVRRRLGRTAGRQHHHQTRNQPDPQIAGFHQSVHLVAPGCQGRSVPLRQETCTRFSETIRDLVKQCVRGSSQSSP